MRTTALLAILILLAPPLLADDRHVEFDDKIDFSSFKTFVVRDGQVTSRKAELDNALTLKTIEDAIRSALSSKGLKETQDSPDLMVSFSLGEVPQRKVIGKGGCCGGQTLRASLGTLVIDLTKRNADSPIWRGVYSDEENTAAKLAQKLPADARKLLSEYPPKKKK